MTAEEQIAFQLCAALDIEPTQQQLGDIVSVLVRYKHAQKIATSFLERELADARSALRAAVEEECEACAKMVEVESGLHYAQQAALIRNRNRNRR